VIALLASALALSAAPMDRHLADHAFVLASAVDTPFLQRHMALGQGVGVLFVPAYTYPGIPEPLSLKLGGLTEGLSGQLPVGDWGAVELGLSGVVHTSLDSATALFVGASASYEVRTGLRVRLHRGQRVQVSGRVGLRRADEVGVLPAALVEALLDDPQDTLPDLLKGRLTRQLITTRRVWQGTLGFSWAVAVSPVVGLQGSTSLRIGPSVLETAVGTFTGALIQVGGGAALDIRPKGGPVGVQVGLRDRVEQEVGATDVLSDRNRVLAPIQLYYDRGEMVIGVVTAFASSVNKGQRDVEATLEAKLTAWF
jgi:hypothetical protein